MKIELKQIYKDLLFNKHSKPINWGEYDHELRREAKRLETKSGFAAAELDEIFEEAKLEVMKAVGRI